MVKNTLRLYYYICIRFKSGPGKFNSPCDTPQIKAIKRMRLENKLLFGELLEPASEKKKRMNALEKVHNKSNNLNEQCKTRKPGKKKKTLAKSNCAENNKIPLQERNSVCDNAENNITNSIDNLTFTDEKSLLSFPLFNVKKKQYLIDKGPSENIIERLVDYHRDYKSISVILSESMSTQSAANLGRWKTKMIDELGPEKFELYSKNLMEQGSSFRKTILRYLKGVPENELEIDDQFKNYWNSLKPVFPLFPNIIETEGSVAHQHLKYKGSFDCLAVFKEEAMLVSWKKSDKFVPSLERTFDMPLHVVACMGAMNFDDRYHFKVEQALLVMAYNDGHRADVFHVNKNKCLEYWQKWLKRLNTYNMRVRQKESDLKNSASESIDKADCEKIDIDVEMTRVSRNDGCALELPPEKPSPMINSSRTAEEPPLGYPLYNVEKNVFDVTKFSPIKPSEEYDKNSYPSVSSVLSDSKSEFAKLALERWKQNMIERLGAEGFEKYQEELLQSGSTLHELVRQRLQAGSDNELEIPNNVKGLWQSVLPVFPLISNVQATESTVAHPALKYRGIIDCIASFRDKLVLIDWKTSEKAKPSISQTYDAPLQVAAYIGAMNYDESYPFNVHEGLIVVVYHDGTKADIYHMDKEKCLKYWRMWLERLNKYQTAAYKDGTKIVY